MILNAVSKTVAGASRIAKVSLLQNEVAKVSSIFTVSKYIFRYLTRKQSAVVLAYLPFGFFSRSGDNIQRQFEQFGILDNSHL